MLSKCNDQVRSQGVYKIYLIVRITFKNLLSNVSTRSQAQEGGRGTIFVIGHTLWSYLVLI
jgi:hypothetical protein